MKQHVALCTKKNFLFQPLEAIKPLFKLIK